MSISNSIEKIKREIAYRKMLIIDGNVMDFYFKNDEFVNLNNLLLSSLEETKLFDNIFIWDRVEGLVSGDETKLNVNSQEELSNIPDDIFPTNNQEKDPSSFFETIYESIIRGKSKNCFIVNYSNYLFPQEQGLSNDDRANLTVISRAVREAKNDFRKNGSCIIFVTNNISQIPVSLYQNNPDVKLVTISNPDRKERTEIIESLLDYFRTNVDLASDEMAKIDLIDGLDNFTAKEIMQVVKLSRNSDYLSIPKLLAIYKYGKKESPWELIDTKKIKKIEEVLGKRVKGQDAAIQKVKDTVIKAKTGLSGLQFSKTKSKPKGVLFFVGPTGVGKTELAKSLAEFLFGDEGSCVRFDMSEYNHEHSDQRLVGAPPGYVGYEAGGQLTNLIKERPFCVLLFDEIEKAHPKILDKFLQILEDGRLTDNKGETVYFSECVIIFTSNIGSNKVNVSMDYNEIKDVIFNAIKTKFETEINRPELLGRIGYSNIVTFDFIKDKKIQKQIASAKLVPIIEHLKEVKKLNIVFDNKDEFLDYIVSLADPTKGGRDILNKLEDIFITKLSYFIFENEGYYTPGSTAKVNFDTETKEIKIEI